MAIDYKGCRVHPQSPTGKLLMLEPQTQAAIMDVFAGQVCAVCGLPARFIRCGTYRCLLHSARKPGTVSQRHGRTAHDHSRRR